MQNRADEKVENTHGLTKEINSWKMFRTCPNSPMYKSHEEVRQDERRREPMCRGTAMELQGRPAERQKERRAASGTMYCCPLNTPPWTRSQSSSTTIGGQLLDRRCELGSSFFAAKTQSSQMLSEQGSFNVFGENIRRILSPGDLLQHEVPGSHPVVRPQICCGWVTDLAETSSPADPDSGARICLHNKRPAET